MRSRTAGWLILAGCVVLLGACAHYEESGLPGSAASLARNKMMLVREDPSTFGHYRMRTLKDAYPDLKTFVGEVGEPDFLAESYHDGYEYVIFYYLEKRKAYACKVSFGRSRTVEFAGPYPITPKEYKTLDEFRKGSNSR